MASCSYCAVSDGTVLLLDTWLHGARGGSSDEDQILSEPTGRPGAGCAVTGLYDVQPGGCMQRSDIKHPLSLCHVDFRGVALTSHS